MPPEYTRAQLIALCEAGSRPQDRWHDRDSECAQRQLGEALMLLKAGCDFRIESNTDEQTVWIEITAQGFMYFETREADDLSMDSFYIPTQARLDHAGDQDWY